VFYGFLADLVVLLHFCFVLFVVFGGFLVLWKSFLAWYHLPAVVWGAAIEFTGCICPLTPLENMLRNRGGGAEYAVGFVEHYIMPVLYSAAMSRKMQIALGMTVLGVNCAVYVIVWQKKRISAIDQQ